MSTDPDKDTACPHASVNEVIDAASGEAKDTCNDEICEKKRKKPTRTVCFPDENKLVTQYFEPANPWHNVPSTTRAQLAAEYLESCRRHNTTPVDSVLQQIRELPESSIGGSTRAPRLVLSECALLGTAPADALEALLRKVQFRRLEIDHAEIDDEGAEALFDMVEYYESATVVSISGPRHFGIRGWQAASRMIKKSAELSELEVTESPLEASHAPVLARALRPHTCRVRALCLQRAALCGEPLLCLVIALKSNSSIRELRLGDNRLSPSDAAQLGSLLRFNTTIQLLDLSNNQIQDAGVGHIADALVEQAAQTPPSAANSPLSPHHCPLVGAHEVRGLAFLVLWNNQLTRNCAAYLSKALRSSRSLCVLNIGRNALGTEAVRALGAGGALVSLGLQAAKLGPDAARALADLIRADTELQRLDLRDNKLGSAGLQAILAAMRDNTTLTQIDLDDPTETSSLSADDSESATIARLTLEIRALCRINEPPATSPDRRAHRKISLTCNTTSVVKAALCPEEEKRVVRLRSPLPSPPAASPTPSPVPGHHHQSRFSVTRVTPERDSPTDSSGRSTPTRPTYCPPPSRFKVVQVAEPPQIQVHPSSNSPRRTASRFSVTRNYDTMYNPQPSPPPDTRPSESPVPIASDVSGQNTSVRPVDGISPAITEGVKSDKMSNVKPEFETLAETRNLKVNTVPVTTPESVTMETKTQCGFAVEDIPTNVIPNPIIKQIPDLMRNDPDTKPISDIIQVTTPNVTGSRLPSVMTKSVFGNTIIADSKATASSQLTIKPEPRNETIPVAAETSLEPPTTVSIPEVRANNNEKIAIGSPRENFNVSSLISAGNGMLPIRKICLSSGMSLTSPDFLSTGSNPLSTEPVLTSIKPSQITTGLNIITPGPSLIYSKTSQIATGSSQITTGTNELSKKPCLISSNNYTDFMIPSSAFDIASREQEVTYKNSGPEFIPRLAIESAVNPEINLVKPDLTSSVESEVTTNKTESVKTDNLSEVNDAKNNTRLNNESISNSPTGAKSDKTYSDVVKNTCFNDKIEHLTHNEEISGDNVLKSETKLIKNSVHVTDTQKVDVQVEVTVKKEVKSAKVDQNVYTDFVNIDDLKKQDNTMKQIELLTEDLGNIIKEMRDISTKNKKDLVSECVNKIDNVPAKLRDSVVLKKNKSESSLDSPDLEVSRLMNKKLIASPFCDSSSSLEISGSSMESLNAENPNNLITKPIIIQESVESDTELDRRKTDHVILSTESSIESTSEVTPVNNFLNMSVSSNESVSPIFGIGKKIHDSLSSLEASVSSLDSARQEKVMVTSADSGIEYSLQHPSENKDDNSSNEGTLTNNSSSLRETVKNPESLIQHETLTSPKRTSSLLDVPALKTKGLDRMRKISWVPPSSSFNIATRGDIERDAKPSHLEKLLSLFQHPTSLFTRNTQSDDEKKSASNTPPRKDSSLTSSFWSWGSTIEKFEKDEKEDSSSETTDSTLSERVQVSFVDESFSKKLDSKTPSTDTDNTLSEFQSFPIQNSEISDCQDIESCRVTALTTDDNIVQKCLGLSFKSTDNASSNGNRASDNIDLIKPNDLNKNVYDSTNASAGDNNKNSGRSPEKVESAEVKSVKLDDVKLEPVRPRSFAAVLKSSGSENSLDKPTSPDTGQPIDKLPSKIIRGIKENISPENTLTSSMSNTKALAFELTERAVINQPIVNAVWEVTAHLFDKNESKVEDTKVHSDLAPIATIEETCDEAADNTIQLDYIDDDKNYEKNMSTDSGVTSLEGVTVEKKVDQVVRDSEAVDLGKDALSYLIYENQDFEPDTEVVETKTLKSSLAQELKEAELKEMIDLSPELIIDEAIEVPEVFKAKDVKGIKTSPVIPERAKLIKSNSLEDLSQFQNTEAEKSNPKIKTIVFKVPESTTPRDIPERRSKLRTRSGSSPKSLPESLNKPCPLTKMDTILSKKKKKVSSLGKMARDSLLALNMSEDEIAEFRRSYKLTSVESLRSLESVSEDANSQSGHSIDSRCRACLRMSQESLMSLDSITEDCNCGDKPGRSAR